MLSSVSRMLGIISSAFNCRGLGRFDAGVLIVRRAKVEEECFLQAGFEHSDRCVRCTWSHECCKVMVTEWAGYICRILDSIHSTQLCFIIKYTIFICVPCIFIMLIFFYQQMHVYLTYKILKCRLKHLFYSHSYMFRSVQTIIRESILSLAKVTFF